MSWGERRDSNPRPLEPQSRALPTELRPPSMALGAPGRTRTCDPRLRRPLLYPAELRAQIEVMAGRGATLVGAEGFEPPTSCSQSRCATRLRHAPQPRCGNDTHRLHHNQFGEAALGPRSRHSASWMMPRVDDLEPFSCNVGVDLGGGYIAVPEQHLDHAEVCTVIEEVGCECVSQRVRGDIS